MKRDGSGKGFVFQAQGASFCLHFWCQGWSGSLHPPCRAGLGLFLPRLANNQSCAPYRKIEQSETLRSGYWVFMKPQPCVPS